LVCYIAFDPGVVYEPWVSGGSVRARHSLVSKSRLDPGYDPSECCQGVIEYQITGSGNYVADSAPDGNNDKGGTYYFSNQGEMLTVRAYCRNPLCPWYNQQPGSYQMGVVKTTVTPIDYVFLGEIAAVSENAYPVVPPVYEPAYAWFRHGPPNSPDPAKVNFYWGTPPAEVSTILGSSSGVIIGKLASASVDDTWVQGSYWFKQTIYSTTWAITNTLEPLTVAGPTRLILTDGGNAANKTDTAGGTGTTLYLAQPPEGQTKTMNMSLYWGPGSPNLNGSHGKWKIVKMDGSSATSWSPANGTFTGSGGATIASSTWTGTPLEREFKVQVWCDNVTYNGVCDSGEVVFERPVTVFKVQIKSPPDGLDPPRQYVAAGGSVGYYAYIIPDSAAAAGLGFAWTGNNVPAKFTLAGAASQTVTVTAGSQPSSAVNAEQVTVTVKAPVTNVALTQASQNFTIVRIDTLVLTDRLLTGNFVQREAGTSFVPTLFLSRDAAGVAKLKIDIYSSPANFMPDRFWWQITNVSNGALSNSWTLNKSRTATNSDWGPPGSDPERHWTVTSWFDDNGNGVFDTAEAVQSLSARVRTDAGIAKIPLGGSAGLSDCIVGKVYVPTRWGGTLTLSGGNVELFYTDGSDLTLDTAALILTGGLDPNIVAQGNPCEYSVTQDNGWFYVKAAASATISAAFLEDGAASVTPWNGWYWPRLDSVNPNLYDSTGSYTPLKKYDMVYGTSTRAKELATFSGGVYWEGHCWGWSLASIARTQPSATTVNGVSFGQDEMEGLYTELANGALSGTGSWTWVVNGIPPGPPTAASNDAVDIWPGKVHNALVWNIRVDRRAMTANLRASGGGDPAQIWNHAVYKYESSLREAAGGNEKVIELTTLITSNTDGPGIPPDSAKRQDTYVYVLEYDSAGEIMEGSSVQNWISCSGFAPQCLGTVATEADFNWRASHCSITKANVDALNYP
jgi:hypothetical protein